MLSLQERNTLVAVARLYYEDNLTQAEIAQKIGVSRPMVSKMLAKARQVGIVHIEIRATEEGNADLLRLLQEKYGLTGGLVLRPKEVAWTQIARYLANELTFDRHIGLGWGYALGETVKELAHIPMKNQEGAIYPLIGSAHIPHQGYHPDELVQLWGGASGRTVATLQCQAFPVTEEERLGCEATSNYQRLSGLWHQTSAAVVCIKPYPGVPDEATATRFGEALRKQHAVGSMLSYYFNERGEFISGNNDYCIHIPLATLYKCPKIIGLAVDVAPQALKGALASGLFSHLILREEQALSLI